MSKDTSSRLNRILELIKAVYDKRQITISEINALSSYKSLIKYKTINEGRGIKKKEDPRNRDRTRQKDIEDIKKSGLIVNYKGGFALYDYADKIMTPIERELQRRYLLKLEPKEISAIKILCGDSIFDIYQLKSEKDYYPIIVDLLNKVKEHFPEFGSEIPPKKILELYSQNELFKTEIITSSDIDKLLIQLSFEITDANRKEVREFFKLKNPAIIFENK